MDRTTPENRRILPLKDWATGCVPHGYEAQGRLTVGIRFKKRNQRKGEPHQSLERLVGDVTLGGEVSGAGEPPPCALSDTDVNLSAHPAPIIQPSVLCPTANAEITRAAFWQFFPTKKPHSLDGLSTFSISSLPI